jgi:predicted ester cyclase
LTIGHGCSGSARSHPTSASNTSQRWCITRRCGPARRAQRSLNDRRLRDCQQVAEIRGRAGAFGPGIAGYQSFLGHLFSAFPDDVLTIELITADGHKGEFLKIPATGKSASWTEIQFFRIANGKHWVDVDIYGWFQQLGVIPPN